jgi:hypothetical protein
MRQRGLQHPQLLVPGGNIPVAELGARVKRAAEGSAAAPASAVPLLATATTTDLAQSTAGEATQVAQVLKVDRAKVDALMNLIA